MTYVPNLVFLNGLKFHWIYSSEEFFFFCKNNMNECVTFTTTKLAWEHEIMAHILNNCSWKINQCIGRNYTHRWADFFEASEKICCTALLQTSNTNINATILAKDHFIVFFFYNISLAISRTYVNYSQPIDVWSLQCCLAILAQCLMSNDLLINYVRKYCLRKSCIFLITTWKVYLFS